MTAPWYATREQVKAALDLAETARTNRQVDRLLDAASRDIERRMHRTFYPTTGTRYFDWPNEQMGYAWRLWLDQHEVIELTSVSSGGVAVTDYFLEPQGDGPPYTRLELDLSGSDAFGGGATHQRDITLTGTFGYRADETPAGQLDGTITSEVTTLAVTDSAAVGVGDLIRVDTERMVVTGKNMTTTGQTINADLSATKAGTAVTVDDGTAFALDETILIGAERMVVEDIAADTLVVRRAVDGSTLAAHTTGATVYAPRALTVARGAAGTTAANHADGAAVAVHQPPGPIRSLAVAEVLWALQQETSGYARSIGSGDAARQASLSGITALRKSVYEQYGRLARTRAV